ncbi:hypothetical protein PGT21_028641 [Puccinia graminis f. sp. tritici]|uniref:No apical meristem-associated C-terminal domain-containing protein n=1 Tax=Puccinia graminis f. sp. tritici TaxID=56615 RepID=A0A5B0P1G2_PUCGR|nr:hypothetical protein PGT21_028641 [Puccinia graminis f. sp. tritici]KAA1121595.1 hypothetical protein PGTUg99_033036 [Puccinia graminis f. sp. tritici]
MSRKKNPGNKSAQPASSTSNKQNPPKPKTKSNTNQPKKTRASKQKPEPVQQFSPEDDKWLANYWISEPGNRKLNAKQKPSLSNYARLIADFKNAGMSVEKNKLKNRFGRICQETSEFSAVFNKMKKISISLGKDTPDADLVEVAKEDFYYQTGKTFEFESAWNVLRNHPRWMMQGMEKSENSSKPSSSSAAAKNQKSASASTLARQRDITFLPALQAPTSSKPPPNATQSNAPSAQPTHLKPSSPERTERSSTTNQSKGTSNAPETNKQLIEPRFKPMTDPRPKQPTDPRLRQPPIEPRFQQPTHEPRFQQPTHEPRFKQPTIEPRFQQPSNRKRVFDQIDGDTNHSNETESKTREKIDHPNETKPKTSEKSHASERTTTTTATPTELDQKDRPGSTVLVNETEMESQKISRLQLEVRRMEAETEYERMQVDIMEKDVSTCTDEYEKEFFLFKKRKIISSLKARESEASSHSSTLESSLDPSSTPKSFIQILKSSFSTGIL